MSMTSSIQQEIIDIVVEQLGVDPSEVTLQKSFVEDLNADSLDQTEFVMSIEEKYGIEIPEEVAEKLKTVGDVVAYVEERQKD
jgi:acyl carrier protein